MASDRGTSGPALDTQLLNGFRFECRPGCGLCCYATPAASPPEQRRLLQIAPEVTFVGGSGGFRLIEARPDGGACQFLNGERCGVHAARPFPCREYPIAVHVSTRLQATVVLACPGVDLRGLSDWTRSPPPATAPEGMEEELAAVLEEAHAGGAFGLADPARRWRRALRRERIPEAPEELDRLRAAIADRTPFPDRADLDLVALPSEDDGIEQLPLFFDGRFGRVAIAAAAGGARLLRVRETGGVEDVLGEYPLPSRMPRLSEEARSALEGYLGYVLRRDIFLGQLLEAAEPGDLVDRGEASLRALGAEVVCRAVWRTQLAGSDGASLGRVEVLDGVRAVDADLLDRPTVGGVL